MSGDTPGDVIIEITRIGDAQRVAAIDVTSGIEVVVQAPANAALVDVRALVLRKLEWALRGETDSGENRADSRPGKLI